MKDKAIFSKLVYSEKYKCYVYRVKMPGSAGYVTCKIFLEEEQAIAKYEKHMVTLNSRYHVKPNYGRSMSV